MKNQSKTFFLPFLKKERVGKDIYSFYFDRIGVSFDFLPGQYIRIVLPHDNPDDRGTTRFFTIASSPLDKDHLMITTRVVKSSFKKTLARLVPGKQIQFFGPLGTFVLPKVQKSPHVFLAGGIGVTPFHSMLKYAAEKKLQQDITLLVSFSSPENFVFHKELTEIAKKHKNIKVVYVTEKIHSELLIKNIGDITRPNYYIVGPLTMVDETTQLLRSLKINSEQINGEDFTGY